MGNGKFRKADMARRLLVKGGREKLGIGCGPPQFRHILRPFVQEQQDEVQFGTHPCAGDRKLFEKRLPSRIGRRDDDRPLTLSDGRKEIDHAEGKFAACRRERDALRRIAGRERIELRTLFIFPKGDAVDAQELLYGRRFPVFRRLCRAGNEVALPQAQGMNERRCDEDIAAARRLPFSGA